MNGPRVAQVTTGRFHQFDLARQLERRGLLDAVVTGYPWWKLRGEGLPRTKVLTFPWLHAPYMKLGGRVARGCAERWLHASHRAIDEWAARVLRPRPDVVVAMSGHGLRVGAATQAAGGAWICVRGSTHVRAQAETLRTEHARLGLPWRAPYEPALRREETEYAACDRIAVPSRAAWRSFVSRGVAAERLALVPYGVDVARFYPEGERPSGMFRVVSVGALGVRKGTAWLVEAFARLRHPRKELVLVGAATPEWSTLARRLPMDGVRLTGPVSQADVRGWLGQSHVFALCSVEEGLANVLGQAMACGCAVVASRATGAEELIEDGRDGIVLPEVEPETLVARLDELARDEARLAELGRAARVRVEALGGWNAYGDRMEALVRELVRGDGQ